MSKIIIYGFYPSKSNLGDTLFEHAFRKMLPNHDLIFTDTIPNSDADMLIIGGGSFLDQAISAKHYSDSAKAPTLEEPIFENNRPIVYVSVGVGGQHQFNLHPDHEILIRRAKFVGLRSSLRLNDVKAINPNTFEMPDLVYSLAEPFQLSKPTPKSILFCPNICTVPRYNSAVWMHSAWNRFKLEFSQTLDLLLEDGYIIDYLPMSTSPTGCQIDDYAMVEIKNLMHHGDKIRDIINPSIPDIHSIVGLFSRYSTIITQRYHGMILAELARRPYLSVIHHDKLSSTALNEGVFADFYACSKWSLLSSFQEAMSKKLDQNLPLSQHSFETLKDRIINLLE